MGPVFDPSAVYHLKHKGAVDTLRPYAFEPNRPQGASMLSRDPNATAWAPGRLCG